MPLPPGGGGKITWVHVSTAEVPSTSPAPGTYRVYGKTTLPDHEVVEELTSQGATVLRTDVEDGTCGVKGKIGGDDGPGGCDSWVITIRP